MTSVSSLQSQQPFAGVELGGTKCVAILAHGPDAILDKRTIPTTTPDETLPALAGILEAWHAGSGFGALGIASFGPLDLDPRSSSHGCIRATNKPGWANADVLDRLSAPSPRRSASTPTSTAPRSPRCAGDRAADSTISPM